VRQPSTATTPMMLIAGREGPDEPYYVQSRDIVPLRSDLKPAVKVLSRKPAPTLIARKDPISGLERLTVEDDEDDEENASKPKPLTMEERQAKAAKEREEKQRKYEEVRERLFGTSNPPSGTSTPGSLTPPKGGRAKGRGSAKDGRPTSSTGNKGRQLYDPTYSAKPGSSSAPKFDTGQHHSRSGDDLVTRQPKAPDGSGRGGYGFATRGRSQ
jgi:hypothetical protein